MALIRKTSALSQPNLDRISNLPDNLITHILSFLSTEDAVKTSALSTSWNQQWTLVPHIRFDDYPTCSKSFVNFVNRLLLYIVSPLDLFELMVGRGYDAKTISNWISVALSDQHVRQIDVRARTPSPCCLPDSLYSSKTLVVLKLEGSFVFRVPEKISLESLKTFHFDVSEFEGGESFSRLISSCPVLEELDIRGGLSENVKVLNISSLVLKRLILSDLCSTRFPEIGPRRAPHAYELVLNTPCLQYLEHKEDGSVPDAYHLNTLHCLDTAHIDLYQCDEETYGYGIDPLIPARSLAELIVAISNVRVLYVIQNSFETLYNTALPNFQLPEFHHLINLELGLIESDAGLKLMTAFLQSSPHLESLSFYQYYYLDEAWYPPTDVPFCMLSNLKVIKLNYGHSPEPFLSMVTYFLEKTNCLEKLIIRQALFNEKLIKEVSMLPRASNSCKIIELNY